MEKDTRKWLAASAALCGLLAAIGWIYAIYAVEQTPQMHEIIFTSDNGHRASQNKLVYLFVLPAAQTALCLLLLPSIIGWHRQFQKLREKWTTTPSLDRGIPLATYIKLYAVGLSVIACMVLYRSVFRSLGLIHMWY